MVIALPYWMFTVRNVMTTERALLEGQTKIHFSIAIFTYLQSIFIRHFSVICLNFHFDNTFYSRNACTDDC